MADAQIRRLDDVCLGVFDCPHSTPVLAQEGPYLARSQDIRFGVLRLEDAARVSEETYRERVSRAEPRHGDLLYSREGTYFGIAAEVPVGTRVCLGQRMVLIRPNPAVIDTRYLRYWLNSPSMAKYTEARRDGSVAERLNLPTIRSLPVPVLPLEAQRRIAAILGALDDRLEVGRQANKILDAMARAVFRSWFVDFDPVQAKAEGRSLELGATIASLFPDRFIDSELGAIPEGWRAGTFGTITTRVAERAAGREVVVLSAVASGQLVRSDDHFNKRVYSTNTDSYLIVRQWDFAYNPSRINIGSIGMLEDDVLGAVSPVYVVLRPAIGCSWFLYFMLRQEATSSRIRTLSSGSVRQSLSADDFASIPCVVPPRPVLDAFNGWWSGVRARMSSHDTDARLLAQTRGELLPYLLGGAMAASEPGVAKVIWPQWVTAT